MTVMMVSVHQYVQISSNAIKLSIWYLSSVWHKLCQRFFMVDWGKKIADLQKNT